MTPLHCAAIRGNAEVVNALLKARSKVDEKDEVSMFLKYEIELCTLHACSNVSSIHKCTYSYLLICCAMSLALNTQLQIQINTNQDKS